MVLIDWKALSNIWTTEARIWTLTFAILVQCATNWAIILCVHENLYMMEIHIEYCTLQWNWYNDRREGQALRDLPVKNASYYGEEKEDLKKYLALIHIDIILYNYPPNGRWIVVDIYWDRKRQGIYPLLFTNPEGDSCFSIYQIRRIKKFRFINGQNFFFLKLSRNDVPFFSPFAKQRISNDIPSYGNQSKRAKVAIHRFGKYLYVIWYII